MDTILTIVKLLGGLGLFIYGMKLMGDGLENAAGEGLKKILEKVTKNPLIGVIVGAVVTMVIQSSSATTVMVVGFVNAGLMNLAQAAGIIMGANVGTTVTAQLVAFKLDDIAPIFVFVGAMMVGLIAGALITAVLQSSSATTGILVALATAGALNINEALPIIMGCNIGTCITAMLATVGTNKTAHRAAMLHLIFNVVGTIIFLPIIVPGFLGRFVSYFSSDVNRQIANAHTIFNVINTIIMVPLIPVLCKIVEKLIPGEDDEKVGPKYIDDRLLETPVIAAGQVLKETIRMSNKSKLSLELAMDAFMKNDEKLAEKVYENEQIINNLEECITNYLVKLSKCELSDKEKNIVAATFHVVNDIERIGDHAENLADLTIQKINKKLSYSEEAISEITNMYKATLKALDISIESYSDRDKEKAKKINSVESEIDKMHKKYRDLHIKRLHEGTCSAYAGAIFLDLLSNLERIGDHSTNIAESVIENN